MASPVGLARLPLFVIFAAMVLSACDRSDAGKGRGESSPTEQKSPAEPRLTLKENFKDGRVRYINIKTSAEKNTIVSFFPDPMGSVDEREWWIVATEGKEPKPGLTAVTWRVDRIQARHRDMLGRERKPDEVFDTLRPNASTLANTIGPWSDRSILFWLNSRGEVDQLIEPPSGRLPIVNAAPHPGLPADGPTSDEFRRFASTFYGLYLPEKPVALNDKWTRPYSVKRDPYGSLNGTINCVLKSIDKRGDQNVARIEFAGELTFVPSTQPARPGADDKRYEVKTATYDGWAEFDADAGIPLAADTREDLKFNLIMTAASQPAKAASQPSTQPAPKPMSFTFQLAETRRTQISVSKTAPQKPIVVNPRPAPTTAPTQFRPQQPYHTPTTQPRAPIGIAPRPIPTSQPVRTPPPRPS